MKHRIDHSIPGGYSILEVLIGIAIFAIGMLALASLQGNLTRSASDANLRTVAVNLAEGLIENRRGFARLSDATNTWPAYDDIANETINVTRGGVLFTLNSTVTPYYYNVATDSFTTTAPTGVAVSDYKLMSVRVSWVAPDMRNTEGAEMGAEEFNTDCTDGTGCITVTEIVSSLTTQSSTRGLTQDDQEFDPLEITYNPGQNPDIVALNLGNSKFKESLTPEPDVIRADELVETRFDVITYSQVNGDSFFVRREEFRAVSCECTLKAPPGDAASGGKRPTIWAGDEYAEGHLVDKPYGISANNQQSDLCDTCCRDHHDGGSSGDDHADTAVNMYSPFKSSGEYHTSGTFNGDHKHYDVTRRGEYVLAESDGDDYLEACRLVRVNGFFRVAQDFRQEDLNVFPEDFLDEDAELSTYSTYVTGAVDSFENATYADYETSPPCIGGPSPCVAEPTYGADYDAALLAGEFPVWTEVGLGGDDEQQLRSRGIYIDYFSYDLRAVIDCLRAGGTAATCHTGDVLLDLNTSTNILEHIPFFDVQLTFLNRWTETPTNTPVDTTNEGLEDDNAHSRGVASKVALGGSDVEASGHRGNLGFTDTQAIDQLYAAAVREGTLEVQGVASDGSGSGTPTPSGDPIVSGTVTESVNGIQTTDISVEGLNGALCDRTATGYECEVPAAATAAQVKFTGYGKNSGNGYACLTNLQLVEVESNTAGIGTTYVIYSLVGVPQPDGAGYDIHMQDELCLFVVAE